MNGLAAHDRRFFLSSLVGGGVAGVGSLLFGGEVFADDRNREHSLERGVAWLVGQQADDGGWHSATYGPMRGGVGNTALVLYSFDQLPSATKYGCIESFERGVQFLLAQFDRSEDTDYPTYAAALMCSALGGENAARWGDERKHLRSYLLSQQRDASSVPENAGGWGATHGEGSHDANLSVTRFVLEAIGEQLSTEARQAAMSFIYRCQNFAKPGDGGFFFTPRVDDPLNKARESNSYGTATADGLLALLACDSNVEDLRVRRAIRWLDRHDQLGGVPGIPAGGQTASFREGLQFYYYSALASAMQQCPDAMFAERRGALVREVVQQQCADGSWKNGATVMKEDDPLIATSLAVVALGKLKV